MLIDSGAKLTSEEHGKYLLKSAETGNIRLIRMMIKNGVDANWTNKEGESALQRAMEKEQIGSCKVLIECGAVPILPDEKSASCVGCSTDHSTRHATVRNGEFFSRSPPLFKLSRNTMMCDSIDSENGMQQRMMTVPRHIATQSRTAFCSC